MNELSEQILRELQLRVNAIELAARTGPTLAANQSGATGGSTTAPPRIPAPNALRNGDFSHSENTWFENSPSGARQDFEAAHWFSHDAPTSGQTLNNATQTLKRATHPVYDVNFSDWDVVLGAARLTGLKTIDAPIPGNFAAPGRTLFFGAILARQGPTIKIPAACRLFVGLWDDTAGQRDWVRAANPFALTGRVQGVPAATTERRYRVLAQTDRGYQFLSSELVLAAAPSDASFITGQVYALLEWARQPGVLRYRVYRRNVAAGTYDYLAETTSNSYYDNNARESGAAGYPSGEDRSRSYVTTREGELSASVGVNGAGNWRTLGLGIPVPPDYNQSLTTGRQWFRAGLTIALDREMTDAVVVTGNSSVESSSGEFTARDTGRDATLTSGANTHTATATFVDATHITLSSPPSWSSAAATLTITGGGEHGLLVDLAHLSNYENANYAPHPEDFNGRPQLPLAQPNGLAQGGIGLPGDGESTGGGGFRCVAQDSFIWAWDGRQTAPRPFVEICVGGLLESGEMALNHVRAAQKFEAEKCVRLACANGVELDCTAAHRVIRHAADAAGGAVGDLRVGDAILTWRDGKIEATTIFSLTPLPARGVGTFTLAPGHAYVAGRTRAGGVLSHNLKLEVL